VGVCFHSRTVSTRILNQRGCFTVHNPPNEPIQCEETFGKGVSNLIIMHIPQNLKQEMLDMLDDYGINQATLFPDLDGLSHYINWETVEMVKRGNKKASQ
jgi:hypothetical protein